MTKLVVIANLGRVRPLVFQQDETDPVGHPHLIEEPGRMVELKLERRAEVVTDQSGRFTQSAPVGRQAGMSYGEGHNLEKERGKQALHRVARAIGKIVAEEGNPDWQLVAPKAILHSLQEALPAAARDCLVKTESGDLTKAPLAALEKRLLVPH